MPKTPDERLADLEGLDYDMPDILNIRFSRVDRDIADLGRQIADVNRQMADVKQTAAETNTVLAQFGQRMTKLERAVEALPRVLAEMLEERLPKT